MEQNFTYYFNICGALASGVPQSCKDTPAVAQSIASASALQVNKNKPDTTSDDWCYLVGQYTEDKTSISLINSDDPTVGLKLSYTGSSCSGGKKRIFNIMLTCANKLNPSPQHALELAGCEYTVTMPSVYGCPLECPVYQRALCGGAGYCAYDYDQQKPKCFCNKGMYIHMCIIYSFFFFTLGIIYLFSRLF